jgi:hypothetical protein
MLNINEILETVQMIQDECLDIRTITMGISLLDCGDADIDASCRKIYDKITRCARDLVRTGEEIERVYGIPIINKRVAVTPVSMLSAISGGDPVQYARTLQRAADTIGVNFIGGYSALVQKGFSAGDLELSSAPFRRPWPRPSGSARRSTSARRAPASTWTPSRSWAASSRRRPTPPPTGSRSAAPRSSCSATRPRTIRLWRAPSTASASPTASSTSACRGRRGPRRPAESRRRFDSGAGRGHQEDGL